VESAAKTIVGHAFGGNQATAGGVFKDEYRLEQGVPSTRRTR
jgi:hypothetical protein